jgi:predicted nuclease with RNAse H fold
VSHFTEAKSPAFAGRAASAGIDVAEPRKGLDLVVLDRHRKILLSRGRLTVEEAARITLSMRPAVVCIDSPSGWSTSGRSRSAERLLARAGIQSYRTGPDPGDHPFYRWIHVGMEVFARLSAAYPLYRGGAVAGTAAEIFPHASASLLAGALRSRDVPKHRFRRATLREAGVPEEQLETGDRVDAALGALTGLIALDGAHSAVGDPIEGMILLPVARVPDRPLPRG